MGFKSNMADVLDAIRANAVLRRIRPYFPPLNFITIHYLYFIGTCIITSVIFFTTSTPAWSISYTDSLFLVVSAMTEAGLNTVNLSQMNTFQQWLLFVHIMGGSAIFVSISTLHIRKKAFKKRFGSLLKAQSEKLRERRKTMPTSSTLKGRAHTAPMPTADHTLRHDAPQGLPQSFPHLPQPVDSHELRSSDSTQVMLESHAASGSRIGSPDHISFVRAPVYGGIAASNSHRHLHSQVFSFTGVGASPVSTTSFRRPGQESLLSRNTLPEPGSILEEKAEIPEKWSAVVSKGFVGRNSQFHGLTREEREQIGGVEYRAITLLSWLVPLYFFLWQFLGCLSLGAWMAYHASDVTRQNGINPWWNGAFNTVSAFNNSGMSLLDANMLPFQQDVFVVITMGLLILAGNTAYPVFLRLIIWTAHKILPNTEYYADWKDTMKFVLDHPRRVYTHLFPSAPTWWLVLSLTTLNGIDWVAFELLNLGNEAISHIPPKYKVMDGLFQALAVRSGGFYIVSIPDLRIGVQVLYVIMMYISVYPVVITMRNSNVYEERSLGIYAEGSSENDEVEAQTSGPGVIFRTLKRHLTNRATSAAQNSAYFVQQQVRGQLAHDLSWLVAAILFIVSIEVGSFERDPITYSVFNVAFEVTSGYGCVGITTGLPNEAYSFSGGWHKASKLILIAVMLRGRHRGLPVAIDRAVLLPGDGLGVKEEEDHELRRGKSRDGAGGLV